MSVTKERFLRLAGQVFVRLPDPDCELRQKIHSHISDVQHSVYAAITNRSNQDGNRRMPVIPDLNAIVETAFVTFTL